MTALRIGIVLIGRNEGERLVACLRSLPADTTCVYVDSGSTDASVLEASSHGISVVELDAALFSAAHARNVGVRRLLEIDPHVEFIQFLDGDCLLQPGWLDAAASFLTGHPDYAVACGRRRERLRDASVYNRLCDLEWDTPVGEAGACGGDALIRRDAFLAVEGFRDGMIAGEEPEMCERLREKGWRIVRLDAEMSAHDAAMYRSGQWWKRAVRAGHAFAEGNALHPKSLWRRECWGIAVWGVFLPISILLAGLLFNPVLFFLAGAYLLLGFKTYRFARKRWSVGDSSLYAIACVLAKFPQAQGMMRFHVNHWLKRPSRIIEYKTASEATA